MRPTESPDQPGPFTPVPEDLLRPARLGPRLAEATGDSRWHDFRADLIAGGKSNLTFLLTSDAGELILRRPPTGTLLPSAHDMGREVRVSSALRGSPVPVPKIVLFEATDLTLGVPFWVMERVSGHVIRDRMPAGYAESGRDRTAMADALVDTLAALHHLDPDRLGIADLGRSEGFLARQLRRWTQQSQASRTGDAPALDRLAGRLASAIPTSARASIVHGDYRLDNCMMDLADPGTVATVLDWELSTLGDPLTDLGLLLFYWPEPGEPEIPLVPTVSGQGGFPGRAHLLDRYADRTGTDPAAIGWYYAFAHFKFAVIIQGVLARAGAQANADEQLQTIDAEVVRLAEAGLGILLTPPSG